MTTVFDLLLAQYGVGATACPAVADGYDDPRAVHAGLAGGITGVPAAGRGPDRPRVRRERRGVRGRSMIIMGAGHQPLVPLRHDLPRVPGADHAHRLPGRQRRGWAHYVGQEKCRPVTGWSQLAFGLDWSARRGR